MRKPLNKLDVFVILIIPVFLLLSQQTISLLSTTLATSGTAAIQIVELFILCLAFYPVVIQLIVKRKIREANFLSKMIFYCMLFFSIFFVLITAYRILRNEASTGGFYLARVVIESALIFLTLDYFKINPISIFYGFLLSLLSTTIGQYIIIIFGKGYIRGRGPILSNSVIYVTFVLMIIPIVWYFILNTQKKFKLFLLLFYIVLIPALLLAGSRTGFSLALLLSFISIMVFLPNKNLKRYIYYIGTLMVSSLIPLILLIVFGTTLQRNEVQRSISVSLEVVSIPLSKESKITFPKLTNILALRNNEIENNVAEKEIKENKKSDFTIEASNNYRRKWNQTAKNEIFSSTKTFIVGTGRNQIQTQIHKKQSPHNILWQYLLPFGLIGTLFAFGIFFSPMLFVLKKKKEAISLLYMINGAMLVNGLVQPVYGWLVLCVTLMALSYACLNFNYDLSKSK